MAEHICLVTSGPIGSDPRVVKSADALIAAGYQVSVVAADVVFEAHARNEAIRSRVHWRYLPVTRGSTMRWRVLTVIEHVYRRIWQFGWRRPRIAEWAGGRLIGPLAAVAASVRADLYIGHNLPGLSAAGRAAARNNALLAFDAEDDHPSEIPDASHDQLEVRRRIMVMERWMRRCAFRTAAAPLMADRLQQRFGVPFVSILNVFPLADGERMPARSLSSKPSIYWFSQTIGPGRGLELLLNIIGMCADSWVLHLRGEISDDYRRQLMTHAASRGISMERMQFLPPADAGEMSRLSGGYLLGACVEESNSENRRNCLTNKLFQYLLAGVPLLMSDTPAQRALAATLGEAALLIDLSDAAVSAARLDLWLRDPQRKVLAAQHALELAHRRYNWDLEQNVLVGLVARIFRDGRPSAISTEEYS